MHARVTILEHNCEKFEVVVCEIRDALQSLVRLEENHKETARGQIRAFDAIARLETRVTEVEKELPPLLEMRKLIVGAICVVLMGVGGAVLATVGLSKG